MLPGGLPADASVAFIGTELFDYLHHVKAMVEFMIELRIPEHLGMQSGHLGTRTGALGQGRERSDRVSGGVGSGLRFEAFALAA